MGVFRSIGRFLVIMGELPFALVPWREMKASRNPIRDHAAELWFRKPGAGRRSSNKLLWMVIAWSSEGDSHSRRGCRKGRRGRFWRVAGRDCEDGLCLFYPGLGGVRVSLLSDIERAVQFPRRCHGAGIHSVLHPVFLDGVQVCARQFSPAHAAPRHGRRILANERAVLAAVGIGETSQERPDATRRAFRFSRNRRWIRTCQAGAAHRRRPRRSPRSNVVVGTRALGGGLDGFHDRAVAVIDRSRPDGVGGTVGAEWIVEKLLDRRRGRSVVAVGFAEIRAGATGQGQGGDGQDQESGFHAIGSSWSLSCWRSARRPNSTRPIACCTKRASLAVRLGRRKVRLEGVSVRCRGRNREAQRTPANYHVHFCELAERGPPCRKI